MEPITSLDLQFQDAFGEEVLQEGGDGLHAEAGAGGAHGIETRDDDEVEQDVDGHAGTCHDVELLEAAVGGEQGAEDVGRRQAEEAAHEDGEDVGILPDALHVGGGGVGREIHQLHDFLTVEDAHNHDDARHGHDDVERGLDQVVQLQLVLQRGGKHGQQHDGEEVGDVVARVEETVGTAIETGLHALVVQEALQQHRLDAAVDAHQQHQKGKRQTLS